MKLQLAHVETPIGTTALVANDTGLCALDFAPRWDCVARRLSRRYGRVSFVESRDPLGAASALEAYAADQVGEGSERRVARRTLGRALRAVAEKKFQARQLDGAVTDLRRALEELEASLLGEPDGVDRIEVRGEIVKGQERLGQWEEIRRKVTGLPEAELTTPPESS